MHVYFIRVTVLFMIPFYSSQSVLWLIGVFGQIMPENIVCGTWIVLFVVYFLCEVHFCECNLSS